MHLVTEAESGYDSQLCMNISRGKALIFCQILSNTISQAEFLLPTEELDRGEGWRENRLENLEAAAEKSILISCLM